MPLGIQQNNDFTQFTMDVWNDKIFYQEKEFPAGFMAMSILNIPEEDLPELIQAGGAPTFLFPVVVQGSDEETETGLVRWGLWPVALRSEGHPRRQSGGGAGDGAAHNAAENMAG